MIRIDQECSTILIGECVALWGEPEQAVVGVTNHWIRIRNGMVIVVTSNLYS